MTRTPHWIKFIRLLIPVFIIGAACAVTSPAVPTAPPEASTPAEAATPVESDVEIQPTTGSSEDPTAVPTDPGEPTGEVNLVPGDNLDNVFKPFWETWELLHTYFVTQPIDDNVLAQGAITGVISSTVVTDFVVSEDVARTFAEAAGTPAEVEDEFLPFWQTWVAADPGDETLVMRAALYAMVDSLGDQHTSYIDPDQLFQASLPIEGSYEGIGAWVDPDGEYLTIVSPMPDSPAELGGLLPGDQVVKVDGEDMTGVDGNLVIRKVLGPASTEVTLTIRREGVEDFDVVIRRAKIVVPSIDGQILEESNIAYIQLFSFGTTTSDDLHNMLAELMAQNPDGLILDLRNNGGGLLSTAIEIASEFIDDGVLMHEVFGDGSSQAYDALGDGLATDIPMVVLINEGSASASEIVAGAIQDFERGPLIGVTSFGKGSVQYWLDLSDNGAVRITIARWYTPNERLIHEIGLTPDIEVQNTEEDFAAGLDPQLDAAIEYLNNLP